MRYVRQETVYAPAERVWQLLVDIAGWPRWTESMREISRLDDGPLTVGSRARVTQPKGRPTVWTVTEVDPLHNFTWTTRQPGLALTAVHLIEHAGNHVRTTLELLGSGLLAPLGSLIAGSRIRAYLDMESAGLKRAAESG